MHYITHRLQHKTNLAIDHCYEVDKSFNLNVPKFAGSFSKILKSINLLLIYTLIILRFVISSISSCFYFDEYITQLLYAKIAYLTSIVSYSMYTQYW